MHRSFGICNKYIFKRSQEIVELASTGPKPEPTKPEPKRAEPKRAGRLDAEDRAQLEASDTIFLASHHTKHGIDPTHRGGPPGFITVRDDATLRIPDYRGNGMFQTLGNLLLDDRVGLLSIDFTTGRSVQVTGRGSIEASSVNDEFSTRTLVIGDEVRTTWPDVGKWIDIEAFEFLPGLIKPGTPFL
ncbi:MAG: hypothetical protein ACI8TP_000571 [Acidimicrobiales bacterium]|jgi:hypothetical protein